MPFVFFSRLTAGAKMLKFAPENAVERESRRE